MRGLLFAVLFCAISLLFAEALTTLLVSLAVIQSHEFDEMHGLIMLVMLAVYMWIAPHFPKDFTHHHDDSDEH